MHTNGPEHRRASLPPDKCPHCGNERSWGAYAAAHFHIELIATCEIAECGKKYIVKNGRTVRKKA